MNYYNEFDPKAAAWLRELIKSKLIPDGHVDERSITEVKPTDLVGYCQCHFFAGIGGWTYALQLARWPADRPVWTGSCPCQPFSCAGKQLGEKDERHLWPVFFDLIRECRPLTVFGEQVASAIGAGWLDGVCADLEGENYACGAVVLGAHSVGAPHIRQRLYWVANTQHDDRRANQPGRREEERAVDGRIGGMAHPLQYGRGARCVEKSEHKSRACQLDNGSTVIGLGDPHGSGLSQQCGTLSVPPQLAPSQLRGNLGAWSDFEILPCLDGKARRIESGTQCMVNGLPDDLDDRWNCCLKKLQTQIESYASKTKTRPDQVLRTMRETVQPEYIQWCSGRFNSFQTEAVLFAALCQLERELGNFVNYNTSCISQPLQVGMRDVRNRNQPSCPSPGYEPEKQLIGEFENALRELSQEVAHIAFEIAPMILHTYPLSKPVPGRVGLLRGYGNAIVPQVAAEFVKVYLSITHG